MAGQPLPPAAVRASYAAYRDADEQRQLAGRLQTLAEKELRQIPFSAEEELWLKQPAVRSVDTKNLACGVEPTEKWAGWYTDLLPWREKYSTPGASPACIADVHTCPPSELFPG